MKPTKSDRQSWESRNKELEKQIAEKTAALEKMHRELEIDAALEKVRTRTLAMHKSDELSEVAALLFQQFMELEIGRAHV